MGEDFIFGQQQPSAYLNSLLGFGQPQQSIAQPAMSTVPTGWTPEMGLAAVPNAAPAQDWFSMDAILGKNGKGGWGNLALGAAQGLGSLYMGMQQYRLASEAFDENKRQFGLNYNMQRKDLNRQLEDRQAARVASNSSAYQSVGDYMKKHGV